MSQTQSRPSPTKRATPASLARLALVSAVAGLVVGCLAAATAIALGAPLVWVGLGVLTCAVVVCLAGVVSEVTVGHADRG